MNENKSTSSRKSELLKEIKRLREIEIAAIDVVSYRWNGDDEDAADSIKLLRETVYQQ